MNSTLKSGLAAALALGALTLGAPKASAMTPGFAPDVPNMGAQIDAVRWVCGPWRCHWSPNHSHPRHHRPYGWRHW